jgi:hypothetical protein
MREDALENLEALEEEEELGDAGAGTGSDAFGARGKVDGDTTTVDS